MQQKHFFLLNMRFCFLLCSLYWCASLLLCKTIINFHYQFSVRNLEQTIYKKRHGHATIRTDRQTELIFRLAHTPTKIINAREDEQTLFSFATQIQLLPTFCRFWNNFIFSATSISTLTHSSPLFHIKKLCKTFGAKRAYLHFQKLW